MKHVIKYIISFQLILSVALAQPLPEGSAAAASSSTGASKHVRRASHDLVGCSDCAGSTIAKFPQGDAAGFSPHCQLESTPSRVTLFRSYDITQLASALTAIDEFAHENLEDSKLPHYHTLVNKGAKMVFSSPQYEQYLRFFIEQAMGKKMMLQDQSVREAAYLESLMFDPDHGEITPNSRQEALIGLEAVRRGFISAPVMRGGKFIEFYDGCGKPWDVKSFPASPDFKISVLVKSIKDKLESSSTLTDRPIGILLDVTFASIYKHVQLWRELHEVLNAEQLSRIVEVVLDVPGSLSRVYDEEENKTIYASMPVELAPTVQESAHNWITQTAAKNFQYISNLVAPADMLMRLTKRAMKLRMGDGLSESEELLPDLLQEELFEGLVDFVQNSNTENRRSIITCSFKAALEYRRRAFSNKRRSRQEILDNCRSCLGSIISPVPNDDTAAQLLKRRAYLRRNGFMALEKSKFMWQVLSPEIYELVAALLVPISVNIAQSPYQEPSLQRSPELQRRALLKDQIIANASSDLIKRLFTKSSP